MSDDLEKRTRELLEESTARLDGRTLSRLTQARHAALSQLERPRRSGWRAWVPAGAAAGAAALAVLLWQGGQEHERLPVAAAAPVEDFELLADADAPDFAEGMDVEFYEWAAGEMES